MAQQYDIKLQLAIEENNVSRVAEITGHSRNTIAKYRDNPVQEKCKPRVRMSIVDKEGFTEMIEDWIFEDSLLKPGSKMARSVLMMYQEIKKLGFTGSYETLARYVRNKKKANFVEQRTYERLDLGLDIAQIDFGTMQVVYKEQLVDVQILVMTFPYSNYAVVQVLPAQNQECFLYGLQKIFELIGGVPRKIWCDNLKAAVVTPKSGDKAAVLADRFAGFAAHFGFEPVPCNPYAGNEKGNVEKKVDFIRDRFFCMEIPAMQSYEQLTDWLNEQLRLRAEEMHYLKNIPVKDLFEEQRKGLLELPALYPIEKTIQRKTTKYREIKLDDHNVVIHRATPRQKVKIILDWKCYRCYSLDNRLLQEGLRPYYGEGEDIKWQEIFRDWVHRPGCIEHSRWSKHLPTIIRDFLLETPDREGQRERLKTLITFLDSYTLKQVEENLPSLLASAHPYSETGLNVLLQYDHLSRGGGQSHAEAVS